MIYKNYIPLIKLLNAYGKELYKETFEETEYNYEDEYTVRYVIKIILFKNAIYWVQDNQYYQDKIVKLFDLKS